MTRAQDQLAPAAAAALLHRQQARRGDRHVYAPRTRFIPAPLLRHFDLDTTARPARSTAGPATALPQVDIAAEMRAMWA